MGLPLVEGALLPHRYKPTRQAFTLCLDTDDYAGSPIL